MARQSVGQWVLSSPSAGGSPDPWERGKRCQKSSAGDGFERSRRSEWESDRLAR